MSAITEAIEQFSFRDEIAKATPIKENFETSGLSSIGINEFDFFEDKVPAHSEPGTPLNEPSPAAPVVTESDEPYDAVANATSFVHTLTALDSLALSGVVHLKCRKKAGGGKTLKKMEVVLTKEIAGDELSDHEKLLKAKFLEYKENLKLLTGEIYPEPKEIERLIQAAIPYCEATKLTVGAGFAFWASYGGYTVQRVTKILAD